MAIDLTIPVFFFTFVTIGSGSIIEFTKSENAIDPLSPNNLTFRCSLSDTNGSAPTTRRDVDHTDSNMKHVSSIVVTRNNGTIVASISQYANATAVADLMNLEVTGQLTGAAGERGFLELSWKHAEATQAGQYVCHVTTINDVGRHVIFSKSLHIAEIATNFDDLVKSTRNQLVKIKDLEEKNRNQEVTIQNLELKNQQQQSVIKDLQNVDQQQDNSILQLHMDNQQQETSIQDIKIKSNKQNKTIQSLLTNNQNHESSIHKLEGDIQQQETVINDLKASNQLLAMKLQSQESVNQDLDNKISQVMSMINNQNHMESGVLFCGPSSGWSGREGVWYYKSMPHNFSKPYGKTPIVHLSFAYLNSPSNVHSVYAVDLVSVTPNGFEIRCRTMGDRITGMDIRWTSFEDNHS